MFPMVDPGVPDNISEVTYGDGTKLLFGNSWRCAILILYLDRDEHGP